MIILSVVLVFISAMLFAYFGVPYVMTTMVDVNKQRAEKFESDMDRTMLVEDIQKVKMFYYIGPFFGAIAAFLLAPVQFRFSAVFAGLVIGFLIPKFIANMLISKRQQQFKDQLIDGLLIMASSFRGGLSLVQAMEAVVDEMPDPIKQEYSVVLAENKIGVGMDDALNRLYIRMPSPSLQQVVSAILLARETGGNLPVIFSRITNSIRERKKLEENIKVLTLQGKLQAFVMSGLPVAFFLMVSASNPTYFDVMLNSELGVKLLIICAVLWIIGTVMILKISSFKDF